MSSELVKYAAEIVAAYVANHELEPQEVPRLLADVFATLSRLSDGKSQSDPVAPHPVDST